MARARLHRVAFTGRSQSRFASGSRPGLAHRLPGLERARVWCVDFRVQRRVRTRVFLRNSSPFRGCRVEDSKRSVVELQGQSGKVVSALGGCDVPLRGLQSLMFQLALSTEDNDVTYGWLKRKEAQAKCQILAMPLHWLWTFVRSQS